MLLCLDKAVPCGITVETTGGAIGCVFCFNVSIHDSHSGYRLEPYDWFAFEWDFLSNIAIS